MPKNIVFEVTDGATHYRAVIHAGDPVTTCEIFSQNEPIHDRCWFRPNIYGLGVRKQGDTYDRETGCRMALASALRKMGNKPGIRAEFWKLYLEKFPVSSRTDPAKLSRKRLVKELTSTLERDFTRAIYSSVFRVPTA